jgi:hypothetical protein
MRRILVATGARAHATPPEATRARTSTAWHNLAHSLAIPANIQESAETSKTLMNLKYFENLNDIKGAKMASQAHDEGSIPFTRSKQISGFGEFGNSATRYLRQLGPLWLIQSLV